MKTRKIINHKKGPEAIIQEALEEFLILRGWLVRSLHGNLYQFGFPDLYIAKRTFGSRWVEVKNPESYKFTNAQLELFPKLMAEGIGVWILIAATESEYNKLFSPPNWFQYLSVMK
jgi:hypothetical protein